MATANPGSVRGSGDNLFPDNSQLGMPNWISGRSPTEPVSILWENNYVRDGEVGSHVRVAVIDPTAPWGDIIVRNNIVENTQ